MAYREYIGSRYVPIFGRKGETTAEWDNLAPYEPLTIVTHEGNSFISRQYVPAGIDITNNDYWALTGNYNAQIEAYRQEVNAFNGRITQNEEDIAELNDTIDNLNISSLDFLVKVAKNNSVPNPYLFHCFYSYYKNRSRLIYMQNNKTDGTATRYVMNGNLIEHAPLNLINGRYVIDCNTLVELLLMGVPYERSRYAGNQNNVVGEPYTIPFENANEFAIQYYTFQDNENLKELMGSPDEPNPIGIGRWAANQMAYFFYQQSQLTEIKDYRQLQFGDIVFQQTTEDYGNEYGYWRGISHVGMYLGRSGNVIYVADSHQPAEGEADDPIFIRSYPLAYFVGDKSQYAFTYFYRPSVNVPCKASSAITPCNYTYAQTIINTSTALKTFECNITDDEIIFVNVDCEATNVYMTFVDASDTSQGLTIRTDLGIRSGVFVNHGNVSQLRMYAIPLPDTGGGNFKLNGVEVIRYSIQNENPLDFSKAYDASGLTSLDALKTLITNMVISSGAPAVFNIFFDYATSQALGGLNGHEGVTMIRVIANSGASFNATATIQSGTNIYRAELVRSGAVYSEWRDIS